MLVVEQPINILVLKITGLKEISGQLYNAY